MIEKTQAYPSFMNKLPKSESFSYIEQFSSFFLCFSSSKICVRALLKSIPAIGNVLLVCAIFWLIFSIMGVQFFGGLFFKCTVNGVRLEATEVPDKETCIANYSSEAWVNSKINFDNVINGVLALFQVVCRGLQGIVVCRG